MQCQVLSSRLEAFMGVFMDPFYCTASASVLLAEDRDRVGWHKGDTGCRILITSRGSYGSLRVILWVHPTIPLGDPSQWLWTWSRGEDSHLPVLFL